MASSRRRSPTCWRVGFWPRDRPLDRDLHQGSLAALPVRCDLRRRSRRRPDSPDWCSCPVQAFAAADTARSTSTSAVARRDARQPRFIVAVVIRGRESYDDEPGDDLGATRHGRVRPLGHRRHAWHPVARNRHVRAELHHRQPDRALRRQSHRAARARPASPRGGHRARRHHRLRISGYRSLCSASAGTSPSSARPPS